MLTQEGREGKRYMCHANIPLSSHDIVLEGGRADDNPDLTKKGRGREEEEKRRFGQPHSSHYNVKSVFLVSRGRMLP